MSTINYKKHEQGFQKIRNLIDEPKIVMLATKLHKAPFSVCPMTLLQMDNQGDLWFFTSKNSEHFRNIAFDNRVQILYSNEHKQNYISIFGNATHIVDEKKIDELWSPMINKWFDGKEDPDLALLNVNMETAYYWDANLNKLVSFFELIEAVDSNVDKKGYVNLQSY
ncbi:pyridoxamine 5'-phosphate oxidase family protein [Xanthomarina sp. F1114]|uniref:pyridoxamine 5'-phosphate oxidase family protein n=1 Tax=Xanthomarina sp. F1114 TaxID=2996019 RepID=UPI00225DDE34|nr:pyridoxamine 5'-phosphate oxidase family protein [Xanthomarina sp. F1114]MCX7547227.1 pyridoxamine 5'-phosphate oxidase family protein [Xanthomarina sp. F1114]